MVVVSKREVESFRARYCIAGFGEYLAEAQEVSADQLQEIKADTERRLDESVGFAESSPDPAPEDITSDVYVRWP